MTTTEPQYAAQGTKRRVKMPAEPKLEPENEVETKEREPIGAEKTEEPDVAVLSQGMPGRGEGVGDGNNNADGAGIRTASASGVHSGRFLDIKTAPKDGTRITIRMEGGDEFEARWRPTRLYHRETMHWIESGYWIQADNQAIRIAGEAVGWKR